MVRGRALDAVNDDLRPYQERVLQAILTSYFQRRGCTFSVEIARQGGKNEISSQVEMLLLSLNAVNKVNLIKCSPTFKPQTVVSMTRLKEKLDRRRLPWSSEMGYMIRLGDARAIFLSAEEGANVVGNTAHLLLEVDEAQDVNEDKYNKDFKPMGSTTNCTSVLYGTTWDESSLLEKVKQINLELERRDGCRRHFRFDWQEVASCNPDYLTYVEGERQRLGENHPLFLTQYRLLPVRGGGGFLSNLQRAQLQGEHARLPRPVPGRVYVAGIDLAGEAETEEEVFKQSFNLKQDSTVVSIGEVELVSPESTDAGLVTETTPARPEPEFVSGGCLTGSREKLVKIRLVEHYEWKGRRHSELYPTLVDLLRGVWRCRAVVVDATGIGQPVASFLRRALGSRVRPFTFTSPAKSELGFNLLAAINSGRLKMYAADNSAQYREFWRQMEKARSYFRNNQTVNFYVDPADGHDDYLMSLALLVEAGRGYVPREARGK